MTNKEAFQAELMGIDVPALMLEKAMTDQGITPTTNYKVSCQTKVYKAAVQALEALLSTPDISEGELSIKYDRKAVEARLNILYQKLGLTNPNTPTLKNRTNLW